MTKANKKMIKHDSAVEFLLYKSENGEVKVDVLLQNENIWMSQKKLAALFDVDRTVITKHLKNIFDTGELSEESNVQKMHFAHSDKPIKYYNLDVIIAVGYRVSSKRATQFRIWANKIIKEFVIKGYTMDVERLKNPTPVFGKDYFDEQLEKIRNIRTSERRFYQKITDIYAQCSIDYDSESEVTKTFFATVQNKLHFSITGQTAAEIVKARANRTKQHMGLTSWKNSPNGPIRKLDVSIAKNYLNKKELESLNRIVTMYLDYAEHQASKGIPMTMKNWVTKLNAFLKFNEHEILEGSGKVTAKIAKTFAEDEFEEYQITQDRLFVSDFDEMVKTLDTGNDKKSYDN